MHSETGLRFELQCPQCGAPASLDESELMVDCPYCRVRHLAVSSPYPVSFISPHPDYAGTSLMYLPFWRFKGMAFALVQGRLAHRLLDTSRSALPLAGLPVSLGLRSQTQPLRFVTPETDGVFLKPALGRKSLLHSLGSRLLGLGPRTEKQNHLQVHIGEALSLIYAPVVKKNGHLLDGLTGDSLRTSADELGEAARCAPPQTLAFLPALCPHCGWDLSGPRDSLVLPCPQCSRSWTQGRRRLIAVDCRCQPAENGDTLRLPFWEFRVHSDGLPLSTTKDLLRLANLPPGHRAGAENQPLIVRIPGFKINPALFLRLARQLTLVPQSFEQGSHPSAEPLFPVTLPAREAFQAVPVLLCRLARDKKGLTSKLAESRIKPKLARLHYLAFQRQNRELVHIRAGLSLQENALRFGRML